MPTIVESLENLRSCWEAVLTEADAVPRLEDRWKVSPEVDERWRDARRDANIALGPLRRLLGDATVDLKYAGERDAFDFVLAEADLAGLSWNDMLKQFKHAASVGTMRIMQAFGTAQQDAARPSDSIESLAEAVSIDKFVPDFQTAQRRLNDGDWRDAVHSSRAALEVCVKQVANRLTPTTAERHFANAVEVLESKNLIDQTTAASFKARDIGLYGWLSNRGSHREDGGTPLDVGAPEATFALGWTRASIELVLNRLVVLAN